MLKYHQQLLLPDRENLLTVDTILNRPTATTPTAVRLHWEEPYKVGRGSVRATGDYPDSYFDKLSKIQVLL